MDDSSICETVYWSSAERIYALAAPLTTNDRRGKSGALDKTGAMIDEMVKIVKNRLQVVSCSKLEIVVRDNREGFIENFIWSTAEVVESVPWIMRKIAMGCEIQMRPVNTMQNNATFNSVIFRMG